METARQAITPGTQRNVDEENGRRAQKTRRFQNGMWMETLRMGKIQTPIRTHSGIFFSMTRTISK